MLIHSDILLSLPYKGSRNYLHGTDFFNVLLEHAADITGHPNAFIQHLTFRRYARRPCVVKLTKPDDLDQIVSQVRFLTLPEKHKLNAWIIETSGVISERRPFNESLLLKKAQYNPTNNSTVLLERTQFSSIEEIVVLTKYLNNIISPQVYEKWLFAQLDLSGPINNEYHTLEIKIKNLIANKFSLNEIIIDNKLAGTIRFIVGTP